MAYDPAVSSIVVFQKDPTKLVGTVSVVGMNFGNSSMIVTGSVTAIQGTNPWQVNMPSPSVVAYQLAGSVLAVSGSFSATPQASINALQLAGSILAVNMPSPSVIAYQAAGSIMAVSGSFTANPQASINALQLAGSVLAVNMPSSSMIAYQLAGSVLAVSGSFSASPQNSIIAIQAAGSVMAVRTDNASVVAVLSNSSVTALQGTNPWQVNMPSPSVVAYQAAGSIMAVSGSFTANPQGSITALQLAGSILAVNMPSPSVIAYQLAGSVMAISGSFSAGNTSVQVISSVAVAIISGNSSVTGTMSVLGTVPVTQSGIWISSIVNTIPSSLLVGASVIGTVPVTQSTSPWVIQSVVGTYSEDAASTDGDKGIFVLGVRNDTMSSLVSADKDYGAFANDSQGRMVIKPFIPEDGTIISYSGSVTSASVTLIQASVTGKKSYITDFWIANTGNSGTLLQFRENTTSVIGNTLVPAGGGSNSPGIAIPIKTSNAGLDLSFTGLTATSILYVTVKGYQAP